MSERPRNVEPSILADAILEAAEAAGIGVSVSTVEGTWPLTVYASEAAVRIMGWPREILLERGAFSFVVPEDVPRLRERLARAARGDDIPASFETEIIQQSGTRRPIRVAVARLTLKGEWTIVAFFEDISE